MITLDLPPHVEQTLISTAQSKGMSIGELITQWISASESNPMIAKAQSLPSPTSYTKNAVELQREWRNEWN